MTSINDEFIVDKGVYRKGWLVIILIASVLFLVCGFTKFKQTISGQFELREVGNYSVTAPTSGDFVKLVNENSFVDSNTVIGYYAGHYNYLSVMSLKENLLNFDHDSGTIGEFKENDIGPFFNRFLSLKGGIIFHNQLKSNVEKTKRAVLENKNSAEQLYLNMTSLSKEILDSANQISNVYSDIINRKRVLYQDSILSKDEYSAIEIANSRLPESALSARIDAIKNDLAESKSLLDSEMMILNAVLSLEKSKIELLSKRDQLLSDIQSWEVLSLIRARTSGRLNFNPSSLLFENTTAFVKSNEKLAGIQPDKGKYLCSIKLSKSEVYKVDTNQRVILRIDEFPYLDHGTFETTIKDVAVSYFDNEYRLNLYLSAENSSSLGSSISDIEKGSGTAEIVVDKDNLFMTIYKQVRFFFQQD